MCVAYFPLDLRDVVLTWHSVQSLYRVYKVRSSRRRVLATDSKSMGVSVSVSSEDLGLLDCGVVSESFEGFLELVYFSDQLTVEGVVDEVVLDAACSEVLSEDLLDPVVGLGVEVHEHVLVLGMVDVGVLGAVVVQPEEEGVGLEVVTCGLESENVGVHEVLLVFV